MLGQKINFLNTHFSFEFDDAIIYHFDQTADILKAYDSYIITADYNTNDFSLFEKFHDSKIVNGSEKEIFSFPWSETTGSGIDNIVMTNDWSWKDADLGPMNHSDHRMLYATLEKEV